MSPSMYDRSLLKSQRVGQGCKPVRCTLDMAHRRWLGGWRSYRLATHEERAFIAWWGWCVAWVFTAEGR
jgi:hypothetical protein